ncbi:MAG: hypothetical protein ACFB2X_09130 [Rivularia sp. (in: cyanobacteria)]
MIGSKNEGRGKKEEGRRLELQWGLKSNASKRLAEHTVGIAWQISYTV